jgi:hypothetical protein
LDDAHDGGHDGPRHTEPSMATATAGDAACVSGSASHNRSIRFNFLLCFLKFKANASLTPSGGQHEIRFVCATLDSTPLDCLTT